MDESISKSYKSSFCKDDRCSENMEDGGNSQTTPDKTARIVYAVNEADGRRREISCVTHAVNLTAKENNCGAVHHLEV